MLRATLENREEPGDEANEIIYAHTYYAHTYDRLRCLRHWTI